MRRRILWTISIGVAVVGILAIGKSLVVSSYSQATPPADAEPRNMTVLTIKGSVFYPNGEPVSDALIYAFQPWSESGSSRIPTSSSDKDGHYSMELNPGDYQLCAWKQSENYLLPNFLTFGLPSEGKCADVTMSSGENQLVDLRLAKRANSLKGKIVNWKEKNRWSDAKVILYRPLAMVNGQWELTSREKATKDAKAEVAPDENGDFVINGLPAGAYFIRIEAPGLPRWFYNGKTSGQATPVHIVNDRENRISISLP